MMLTPLLRDRKQYETEISSASFWYSKFENFIWETENIINVKHKSVPSPPPHWFSIPSTIVHMPLIYGVLLESHQVTFWGTRSNTEPN